MQKRHSKYRWIIVLAVFAVTIALGSCSDDAPAMTLRTDDVWNPVSTSAPEATTEATTAATVPEQPASGGRESCSYTADGKIAQKICYDENGKLIALYIYDYENGLLCSESVYDALSRLVSESRMQADGSKVTRGYVYDAAGNVLEQTKKVYSANGILREEHTLNPYGDSESAILYDEAGNRSGTRTYYYTQAGYPNGYTDTDLNGKKTRYNNDGSVYVQTQTQNPGPNNGNNGNNGNHGNNGHGGTRVVEEKSADGTRTVKTYAADGRLLTTFTYRIIAGKERLLRNVDNQGLYGEEFEYDNAGKLLRKTAFNTNIYGRRTKEVFYDANNTVVSSKDYTYDDQGRKTSEIVYDASGTKTGYTLYEYIAKKDGTYKTKVVVYDAKGNVKSSVVY